MVSLRRLLVESFQLLVRKPQLFAPKIITALLSSLWMVGVFANPQDIGSYMIALPFILVLGTFASVVVQGMVKASDDENILSKGFELAASRWKGVLVATVLMAFLGFMVSLPASIGMVAYTLTGNALFAATGVSIAVVAMFISVYYLYFYPIALIETSAVKALTASSSKTKEYPREVAYLTLISFVFLAVAALPRLTSGGSAYIENVGYVGFVTGRVISAAVSTYLFVVSPKFYLETDN